jgi:hypothetical protein
MVDKTAVFSYGGGTSLQSEGGNMITQWSERTLQGGHDGNDRLDEFVRSSEPRPSKQDEQNPPVASATETSDALVSQR